MAGDINSLNLLVSLVFIVLNARDGIKSKYSSIIFSECIIR